MKRTIIRILGSFMAAFAAIGMRDSNAETINYTIYSKDGGYACRDYVFFIDKRPSSAECNEYKNSKCGEALSYTCEKCGDASQNDLVCQWCLCTNKGASNSALDDCDDTGFWSSRDWTHEKINYSEESICGNPEYTFRSCTNGAYKIKTTAPCTTSSTVTDVDKLKNCCAKCPINATCDPNSNRITCVQNYYPYPTADAPTRCERCPLPGINGGANDYAKITACFLYKIDPDSTNARYHDDSGAFNVTANCFYSTTQSPKYPVHNSIY